MYPAPNYPSNHFSIGYEVAIKHPLPFVDGQVMIWEESGYVDQNIGGLFVSTKLRILPDMTFSLVNSSQ